MRSNLEDAKEIILNKDSFSDETVEWAMKYIKRHEEMEIQTREMVALCQ